jgi:NAD(P)-dependent dehydrogenase (short-subunit alcohol dehydrogenase family)
LGNKYYQGKNAVVTGAASGIGRELALQLARMEVNLLISDINEEGLEGVKKELEEMGGKVASQVCDITDPADVQRLAEKAALEFETIHFIFQIAGIAAGGRYEWIPLKDWERVFKINVWGPIYIVNAFIGKLLEQGFGHIILTSSMAGAFAIGGLVPYTTTKFAVAGFGEALYAEYKSRGLDVSIICPFPLQTRLIEGSSIGLPEGFLEGLEESDQKQAIEVGKQHFWGAYMKKESILKGFGGGNTVENAVRTFLKQIPKKKLYIFDRRYGRLLQLFKGMQQGIYKYFLRTKGEKSVKLIDASFKRAFQSLGHDAIEKAKAAGNKYATYFESLE